MSRVPYVIHHITVKGESSLAARTYPNIVQILRMHVFCLAVKQSQFDLRVGRSSYGANHYKLNHIQSRRPKINLGILDVEALAAASK